MHAEARDSCSKADCRPLEDSDAESGPRRVRAPVRAAVATPSRHRRGPAGPTNCGVDQSVVTDGSCDLQHLRMELIDVLRRHGGPGVGRRCARGRFYRPTVVGKVEAVRRQVI